ncbi:WcaF family extracellular polysaccharide biosynthesis acetyltransferase [bacterium]|nr:WcaF family extracellular polysaccharide biosynthesis acetyltransferase [bacterium]
MIDLSEFNNSDFDRGASRFKELAWMVVKILLFCHSVPVPSGIKRVALRLFGGEVGQGVVIRSRVDISFPWRIKLGHHVWIGNDVSILSLASVTIGSNSCVSQRTFLCTGSHRFDRRAFDLQTAPIEIRESSWICAQSFVGPGVTMGAGSRCLPGSVVVKDVPSNTTVAGVPARPMA